jgi:hypothetical protein
MEDVTGTVLAVTDLCLQRGVREILSGVRLSVADTGRGAVATQTGTPPIVVVVPSAV